MTRKHFISEKKGKEERKRRKKKKKMIERKLFRIAIAILHIAYITYTKFYHMSSSYIYKNYFIFIINYHYDNWFIGF